MLKVHFVAGTRAGRVVWLLEELGLKYEVLVLVPMTWKMRCTDVDLSIAITR